jgi:phosphoglycerate dehydrogenase-like enzyme
VGLKIVVYDSEAHTYKQLLAAVEGVRIVAAPDYDHAFNELRDADALLALAPYISDEMVAGAPKLRWIQALTTGVDTFDRLPSLKPEVVLSSARGIHGPQMAEMALMLMLGLSRDFPAMVRNHAEKVWRRWPQRLLVNRTVCIVGLGVIAAALAERCRPFGMRVIGVTNQPRRVEGFDKVYARSQMVEAFARSDYVVVLTPYSAETHHMIDAAAIGSIGPDGYLINLARGGVVDERAVLDALCGSAIAGAAMDVFETEPLPVENPLWEAPNLILTAHMGGFSDCYPEQLAPIIEHNLRCILSGELGQMKNRVWTLRQRSTDCALV